MPRPPAALISAAIRSGRMRSFVSSASKMSIAVSAPSTWRSRQSAASPYSAASVLDGMADFHHWMT